MKHSKRKFTAIVFILAMIFALTFVIAGCGGGKGTAQKDVINAIDALPTESALSLGDVSAVEDARTLYDALTEDEKSEVSNYDKLEAAEGVMAILKQIAALTPSITSETRMNVGDEYTPSITGYEYGSVATSIAYSLKNNTAEAVLEGGVITAAQDGEFTVEAMVSYAGYNIKRNAELTVSVVDSAKIRTLNGTLTYDTLTNQVDCADVSIKFISAEKGEFEATINANGGWDISVPYGKYTVTAMHPDFVKEVMENVVVGESTSVPAIEFKLWKAQGSIAHKNDGNETIIASNFEYDLENEIYQTKGGLIRSGISRINFNGMKVEAGKDFVFKADLLYTGYEGAGTSFAPVNAYHHGLAIYDGNPDIKESEYSYGLLLSNAVIDNGNQYKGHFSGFSAIDTAPTQYAQVGSTPSNVHCGIQGDYFGTGPLAKPGNNNVALGQDKIALTYVRKSGVWYMIAEIYKDGAVNARYVRQATGNMLNYLNELNNKTIYLGLVNQVTSPKTENTDQTIKWGNVYFSTDSTTVESIDLQDGITDPQAAIAAINALPAASRLTLDDADAVATARALYNALTDKAQAQVDTAIFDKLRAAETALATLRAINELQITATSAKSFNLGDTYTPEIEGYEYEGIGTSISYALKADDSNTAGASLSGGNVITVMSAGIFTVEATVTYTGYNIEKKIEWTVTVIDPTAATQLMSVTLKYDKLTNSITDTAVNVMFALSANEDSKVTAEKNTDGSWQARVPYGEYKVTASYPAFLDASQTVVVSETMDKTELEIEFKLWKAQGSIAHTNDGNETVIASNFEYDLENEIYQTKGGLIRSGISRINFDGMKVEANEDFVFRVDLLYTGYMGAGTSFSPNNAYHHGLAIYDGNPDIKESEFSYGLLLSNSLINSGKTVYRGHFSGFSAIDTAPTKYDQVGSKPNNVHCGMQGDYITTGSLAKPGNNSVALGQDKITLTYVRKSGVWYMIAEIYKDGAINARCVRQAEGTMLENLNSINNKTIYLGLVNQVTSLRTGDYDQIVKWGNLYFATGTGVADGIALI